ncbi:MAG TPA: ATP-binding cassette domain-containing protein [Gaiellaceae bacterium]|nr:ATP-binding cassette domain-containing protein [Gaiellaceae bacterium]
MLSLVSASKRFGSLVALDGVSFEVPRGRLVGFLGPNGAGKTTTMRSVFGLVALDAGEVRWEGRPVDAATRLRFGYMPEERGLYPKMPAGEQLAFLAELHGVGRADALAAARGLLERLELADRFETAVEKLSHGNQQRVQLAAALVHRPELLVLDEPFSGLDPLAVELLVELLRAEAARGAAVLFSSHQLELVEDLCEEVAIVARGRVVASGSVAELRARAGRVRIDLEVAGAPGWAPDLAGAELLERRGGALRLLAPEGVDTDALLAQARAAGEVRAFSFGPPTLAELFLEAVQP